MDMDSSSHPNWLVFSLSNNNSLFQPSFPSTSTAAAVDQDNGIPAPPPHHRHHLSGGPKLEDFMGAAGVMPEMEIYDDSGLKTIAASFLRAEQSDAPQKQVAAAPPPEPPAKKAAESFGQRTSIFRGVTRHRWTGRYEAHLWDNSCRREGQSRKGRQVYLGGYDKEEKAARAYDLAALKYWGPTTTTNFPVSDYEREMEEMKHMTRQEFVASLRRRSSGFSRGASIYRGVTRHHQHGRWQARIGRVAGNKDLYLGTFSTQEEAAEAYDIAAIKFRGLNAVTNFDMSRYDVRSIATSNLPIGGAAAAKPKTTSESVPEGKTVVEPPSEELSPAAVLPFQAPNSAATINFALPIKQDNSSSLWAALSYPSSAMAANGIRNPNHVAAVYENGNGTTPYSVDFQQNSTDSFYSGCGYNFQQHDGSAAARGAVSQNGTSNEALGTIGGGWIQPVFQTGKGNLASTFQTAIFGVE